jgi:DNA repair protein RadC
MTMTTPLYELKKIQSDFPLVKITNSKDAYDFIKQFYGDDLEIYESVFLLLLSKANKTIGYAKISQGGITGSVIDVKIIGKYVIDSLASQVILAHNHPSGNLRPSLSDISVTKKVEETMKLLESELIEHLIVTADGYYSFADEGMLKQ